MLYRGKTRWILPSLNHPPTNRQEDQRLIDLMLGGKGYFLRWWSPTLFETWIAANVPDNTAIWHFAKFQCMPLTICHTQNEESSGFQQVAHWISISKPYLATNPRVSKALNSCFPTLFNLRQKWESEPVGSFSFWKFSDGYCKMITNMLFYE